MYMHVFACVRQLVTSKERVLNLNKFREVGIKKNDCKISLVSVRSP